MVPTIEEVRHAYNNFNLQMFNGYLPRVGKVMFVFDSSEKGAAGYTFVNNVEGYKSEYSHRYPDEYTYVIALNDEYIKGLPEEEQESEAYSVLAHEMIHIYQYTLDFKKYSKPMTWMAGHNKLFQQKMDYLNMRAKELNIKINVKIFAK